VPACKKRKLGLKTVDCVFLGYAHNSAAYRLSVIKSEFSDVQVNNLTKSCDATFFEDILPMKDRVVTCCEASTSYTPEPNVVSLPRIYTKQPIDDNNIDAHRRSKRQRVEKSFGGDFIAYLMDDTPKTLTEAYASLDAEHWKEAIQNEMESILINGTWEICDLPDGCKPVGCKWLFKKKMKLDGTIDKFKARLVAKGFTQKEGEDYFDTYLPVAMMTTICVLVALAVCNDIFIHQMDVKTVFLNGELDDEIYIKQSDGFVALGQENKVCRLKKSSYGLKQAPKQWHEKFDRTLTSAGFVVNETDTCVYYRFGGGKGVILCLYVDDILIFGTSIDVINDVKSFLS
jgi:hypothetical protein